MKRNLSFLSFLLILVSESCAHAASFAEIMAKVKPALASLKRGDKNEWISSDPGSWTFAALDLKIKTDIAILEYMPVVIALGPSSGWRIEVVQPNKGKTDVYYYPLSSPDELVTSVAASAAEIKTNPENPLWKIADPIGYSLRSWGYPHDRVSIGKVRLLRSTLLQANLAEIERSLTARFLAAKQSGNLSSKGALIAENVFPVAFDRELLSDREFEAIFDRSKKQNNILISALRRLIEFCKKRKSK